MLTSGIITENNRTDGFVQSTSPNEGKLKKHFLVKSVLFLSTIIFIIGTIILINQTKPFENLLSQPYTYCRITKDNLCEDEYVELIGVVTPGLNPGAGYPFNLENRPVENPVYLLDMKFSGVKLNAFGVTEDVSHSIPFGSRIQVRGRVTIRDKNSCTKLDFASQNPEICKPDGFRILISPDAIVSIPEKSENLTRFSIFGRFSNWSQAKASCPNDLVFCEGNESTYCYELAPTDLYFDAIGSDINMFLLKGSTQHQMKKPFTPFEAYHIRSVLYTNTDNQTADRVIDTINKVINQPPSGVFTVFSKQAELLTSVDTGDQLFSDISRVWPAQDGIYYLVKNRLNKWPFDGKDSVFIGTLDPEIFQEDSYPYDFHFSQNGDDVRFVTSKLISERTENNNIMKISKFSVLELNLTNLTLSGAQVIKPNIIYQEEVEGFFHFESYNKEKQTLLVSYVLDKEFNLPCRTKRYILIDLKNNSKKEVTAIYSEGNDYCQETIHKPLFVSDDATYLVFGYDFNISLPYPRPSRLAVYTINGMDVSKREYLSEYSLLRNQDIQILRADQKTLRLFLPKGESIFFDFDLASSEFSTGKLNPLTPVYSTQKTTSVTPPSEQFYQRISALQSPKYLSEDNENWYFFSVTSEEKQLYIVKKNSNDLFLAGTFSLLAQSRTVSGELFIIDSKRNPSQSQWQMIDLFP